MTKYNSREATRATILGKPGKQFAKITIETEVPEGVLEDDPTYRAAYRDGKLILNAAPEKKPTAKIICDAAGAPQRIVVEVNMDGRAPEAKSHYSATYRNGKLILNAAPKRKPTAKIIRDAAGAPQRIVVEVNMDGRAPDAKSHYSATYRNGKLILNAAPEKKPTAKIIRDAAGAPQRIVVEVNMEGRAPDAKSHYSATYRNGKLILNAAPEKKPTAKFTHNRDGKLRRVAIEADVQNDTLGDDEIFAARIRNGGLIFSAVPKVKSLDSGKVNLQATVVTSGDRITSLLFPTGFLPKKQGETSYFRMETKDDRLRARSVDVPSYYLAGIGKKMDIRGTWNDPFRVAADQIRDDGATMLDYDRLYTIWQCVSNVSRMPEPIVEIGVLRGGTSALIAQAMKHFDKKGALYSCDTFTGHEEVDDQFDMRHKRGTFSDRTSEKLVRDYLKPFPFVRVLTGDIKQTAASIAEPDLAMIHLDVDVYPTTKYVLEQMAGRLVQGGLLLIDDYGVTSCPGVKRSVDEFVKTAQGFSFLHMLTGQAMLIRTGQA